MPNKSLKCTITIQKQGGQLFEADNRTLEHMFWEGAIQVFRLNFVDWLYIKCSHCKKLRLLKELIFSYNSNMHAEFFLDLFVLLAKYCIVHAETNNGNPPIQVFVRTVTVFCGKEIQCCYKGQYS